VLGIHRNAWLLVLLSAALQIVIFPLPDFYFLCWIAVAPLLIAILHARPPETLQLKEGIKLLPAKWWQAFLLAYVCGILWYAGTCYWILPTMRKFGGLSLPTALLALFLFCLYLGIFHGAFGLLLSLISRGDPVHRRALLLAPAAWVAIELLRARISGFPWDLLGITQVDNIPLARIARATGVYGLSFEIMVVNTAMAAIFLVRRQQRKSLALVAVIAAVVLQVGRLVNPDPVPTDHTAQLVQQNIPILEGADWTKDYFETTLRELATISLAPMQNGQHPNLIVWPESPAPFYTTDPTFRDTITNLARVSQTWVLTGSLGVDNATHMQASGREVHNSGALVSPDGSWVARYDKVHLVPFGEYVPFRQVFSFASGLTEQVGDFARGEFREPLQAGDEKLGVFICYESVFPNDIRQFAKNGAQVFVNISNDGWYGDSGAYAQHLKQARMRAVENARWLLRDTNTGVTSAIDPYGRIVTQIPRKLRSSLLASYALSSEITFYTAYGDWFGYLCAIICVVALFLRLPFLSRSKP
jgi:apolipoprotein N-acyltransferase